MAKYVLFDTETTGTDENDKVIQVGAMILEGNGSVSTYNDLCSTEVPIQISAMEVHNITPEMLENAVPYAQTAVKKAIDENNITDNYLIAHNINFDLTMLMKEGFESNYQAIDTLRVSRHLYPDIPHHRLQHLRYALGLYKEEEAESKKLNIELKAHDALGDVLFLKLLMSKLTKKAIELYPDKKPMDTLLWLTQSPVTIKRFKFGKYKGKEIAEIAKTDKGYLSWMQGNMELDEDMMFTLEKYL